MLIELCFGELGDMKMGEFSSKLNKLNNKLNKTHLQKSLTSTITDTQNQLSFLLTT